MGEAWLLNLGREYNGFYSGVSGQNTIPAGSDFGILKVVWNKAVKEWTYPTNP